MQRSQKRNNRAAPRLSIADDPWPSAEWKSSFRRRLLRWFRTCGRTLPWRQTHDPYAIWVSEVMLQQTQVATVIPYYERFLTRFPTVTTLAAADEQDVLRLWEGLGYYRRARQLHTAAQRIIAQHAGLFPNNIEAARCLPGIGRYTAGAILSFAFDARQPILEANSRRLMARLLAFPGNPLGTDGQKLLWNAAESILSSRGSGRLNQSLIELGSQVCTPRRPKCSHCPVARLCLAHREGLHDKIPLRTPKLNVEHVREASVVVRHRGKVLLVKRAAGQRWAGLWDFPRFGLAAQRESDVHRELINSVSRLCNLTIEPRRLLATLRHGVTRFRITLECHEARLKPATGSVDCDSANGNHPGGPKTNGVDGLAIAEIAGPFANQRWVPPAQLSEYPLSVTGRKIARLVTAQAGS